MAKRQIPDLSLSGQAARRAEQDEHSAALIQAGARARTAGDHDGTPALGVADRGAGVSLDHDVAGQQAASRTVAGRSAADDRQARRIQTHRKLGASIPLDLDYRAPGAGDPGDKQSLALGTDQADQAVPLVEPHNELGVDALIIPDLGN